MAALDSRLLAALQEQCSRRDALLRRGARRVGWKLGMGRRERIGDHIAVGYLTTDTLVGNLGRVRVPAAARDDLHVDAELCVELGSNLDDQADPGSVRDAIANCWTALEVVDLAPRAGEPDSVVVENVFHVAVAFGETPVPLASEQEVAVYINNELRDRAPWPTDVVDRIARAAAIVGSIGESLRAGDQIITGSIVQVPITSGNQLRADFGDHASVTLTCKTSLS